MYKLKNTYIDRMIDANVTSREIDFLLYIANYQNEHGVVMSVYYKEICEAIHISYQKFYDILDSLSRKRLISWEKLNRADVCVTLLDNDFSNKNFKEGYLKVIETDFLSDKFRDLKAGSKLLFLYLKRFTEGKHMFVQNFYAEFCERFHVVRKTLQQYIHELKERHLLFISKKRNKAYHYEMTMRNSTVIRKKEIMMPNENMLFNENMENAIYRKFSNVIHKSDIRDAREVHQIVSMIHTKRAKRFSNFERYVLDAIEASFNLQKEEGREKKLYASLVNKCLTSKLYFA